MAKPSEAVLREVRTVVDQRPPTAGELRVVCLDGPAASGKSTWGRALHALGGGTLIEMDDLYDGWDGLEAGCHQLRNVIGALTRGEPATYQRYDWEAGSYSQIVEVTEQRLLIVEGVGSGSAALDDAITVLVWVEAPASVRRDRAAGRHPPFVEEWDAWAAAEQRHFTANRTRERADLIVQT